MQGSITSLQFHFISAAKPTSFRCVYGILVEAAAQAFGSNSSHFSLLNGTYILWQKLMHIVDSTWWLL